MSCCQFMSKRTLRPARQCLTNRYRLSSSRAEDDASEPPLKDTLDLDSHGLAK